MTLINRGMTLEALAATISQALEAAGIRATLSGGSAVSVYAMNEYESDAVSIGLRKRANLREMWIA